jgi:hypothetical protein
MTQQYSTAHRNSMLDLWDTSLGSSWKLKIRTGAQPANVAAASTGTVLATFTPTLASASGGTKTMVTGVPISVSAANSGTAAHYELTKSDDTVVERGTVTVTGGGGDVTVDNTSITSGQTVQVTGFTKTAPGA